MTNDYFWPQSCEFGWYKQLKHSQTSHCGDLLQQWWRSDDEEPNVKSSDGSKDQNHFTAAQFQLGQWSQNHNFIRLIFWLHTMDSGLWLLPFFSLSLCNILEYTTVKKTQHIGIIKKIDLNEEEKYFCVFPTRLSIERLGPGTRKHHKGPNHQKSSVQRPRDRQK